MRAFSCCFLGSSKYKEKDNNTSIMVGLPPNLQQPSPQSHQQRLERITEDPSVMREGALSCKITLIDGSRAADRSWKRVWGEVRAPNLNIYKQHKNSTMVFYCQFNMQTCKAKEANYVKRKNVLCLNTASRSQVLIQTSSTADMILWLDALKHLEENNGDKEQASPQYQLTSSSQVNNTITHPPENNTLPTDKTPPVVELELPFREKDESDNTIWVIDTLKHLEECSGDLDQASPQYNITSSSQLTNTITHPPENNTLPTDKTPPVVELELPLGEKDENKNTIWDIDTLKHLEECSGDDEQASSQYNITSSSQAINSITHPPENNTLPTITTPTVIDTIWDMDGTTRNYSELASRLLEALRNIDRNKDPIWRQMHTCKYPELKLREQDKRRMLNEWQQEKEQMHKDFWEDK